MRLLSFNVCLVVLLAAGCSDGRLPTRPVKGKVTFRDGRPLAGGVVELRSLRPDAKHLNARGEIGPDGAFVLGTYSPRDGAVEGDHEAIVTPAPPSDSRANERPPSKPAIHDRFRSYERSGLRFTVPRSGTELAIVVE